MKMVENRDISEPQVYAQIDGDDGHRNFKITTASGQLQVQVTEVGKTAGFSRHSPGPQAHQYQQVHKLYILHIISKYTYIA